MPTFQDPFDNEDYISSFISGQVSGGYLRSSGGQSNYTAQSTNLGSNFASESIDSISYTPSAGGGNFAKIQFSEDGSSWKLGDGSELVSNSYSFDGVNDYINIGSDASLDDMHTSGFTFSAWIHPDSAGGGSFGRVYDKGANITYSYLHSVSGSTCKITFYKSTSSTGWQKASTDYVINLGEWNHIAMRWTGLLINDPAIYVNGNLIVLDSNTASGTFTSDAGGDLYLGNRTGANRSFDGKMSDVILYSSELTEAQVQDIYLKGDIPSGYVSRYKFNGDATDESGTNDGTVSGATVSTNIPVIGNLVGEYKVKYFDGINDYVQLPYNSDFSQTGSISFSCWIKPATVATNQAIADKYTHNGAWGWCFGIYTNKLSMRFRNGLSDFYTEFSVDDLIAEEWQHVGFSYAGDGSIPKMYIDGVNVSTTVVYNSGTPLVGFGDNGLGIRLGRGFHFGGGTYYFEGNICNASYFSGIVTDSEMSEQYDSGIPDLADGNLISYWPLNGDLVDIMPSPNNGTNSGTQDSIDITRPSANSSQTTISLSDLSLINDLYYKFISSGTKNDFKLNEITVSYTYTSSAGEEIKNMSFASSSGNEVLINSRDKFCVMILALSSSSNCTLRKNSSSGEIICHVPAGNSKFKASISVEDGNSIYVEGSSNISIVYTWAAD